jgi:hypothetical protein
MATLREPEGDGRPAAVVGLGEAETGAEDCAADGAGAAELGAAADVVTAGLGEVAAPVVAVVLPEVQEVNKSVTNKMIEMSRKPIVELFKLGNLYRMCI